MIAHHFVTYANESKTLVNDKFSDKEYWEGIRDACEYFQNELGIEDATHTTLYQQATEELALV